MTKFIFATVLGRAHCGSDDSKRTSAWSMLERCLFSVCLVLAGIVFPASIQAQTLLEVIQVPASGDAVTFTNSFDQGELFLLKASGSVVWGHDLLDAEFENDGVTATAADVVSNIDVGIDIGLKALRVPKGGRPGRMKWFGGYRADHTYYMLATATGQPFTLKLATADNSRRGKGTITVAIFRLTPSAKLSKPLESRQVSFLDETVQTTWLTSNSVIYLLQAAGDGKVGGAGLGRGDAEYMDYSADGSGKVDVGDHEIDYGLGVDEEDTSKTPRQNWWGSFRLDHTYFMLFAGTGQPIHFHYYDSVYTDNSSIDRLTVNVFPVP